MTLVDAGVFLSGLEDEPVWLPAFYIDVYPTTNADYSRFVAAAGHYPPMHWIDGRCPENLLDHPVVFVTWHDAHAYAEWAGKALPSSQQWEKAARGTRGDTYPWGNQATPAKCNVRESGVGATTPGDRYRSSVSPTESTTCVETSGNGALPRPIPTGMNSRAAPLPATLTAPRRRRSTTINRDVRRRHRLSMRNSSRNAQRTAAK